ncbi:MAG: HEAT repeat domain-containing protein [Planctomycetales bacterium]|nr:HEAT repeat domain-containing protein [Planctomycetales bacterium]
MARQAQEAEPADLEVWLARLSQLGDAGRRELVGLASGGDTPVAVESRRALERYLQELAARAAASRGAGLSVGDSEAAIAMAEALAEHAAKFDWRGRVWVERIAFRLVKQVEEYSPETTVRILEACDKALQRLDSATASSRRMRTIPGSMQRPANGFLSAATPPDFQSQQTSPAVGDRTQPVLDPSPGSEEYDGFNGPPIALDKPSGSPTPLFNGPQWQAGSAPRGSLNGGYALSRDAFVSTAPLGPVGMEDFGVAPSPAPESAGASTAAKPLPRPAPVATKTLDAPLPPQLVDVPPPDELRRMLSDYRSMTDAELLFAQDSADLFQRKAILRVLKERGVADETVGANRSAAPQSTANQSTANQSRARVAQPMPTDRVEAARLLLQQPSAATRNTLRRLVVDPDPRVRLEALTALATTNDPQLAELARQRAVAEPDPEVADAAQRIYETLRR